MRPSSSIHLPQSGVFSQRKDAECTQIPETLDTWNCTLKTRSTVLTVGPKPTTSDTTKRNYHTLRPIQPPRINPLLNASVPSHAACIFRQCWHLPINLGQFCVFQWSICMHRIICLSGKFRLPLNNKFTFTLNCSWFEEFLTSRQKTVHYPWDLEK